MISGCGGSNSDLRKVTGKVTLDDSPLTGAYIQFIPCDKVLRSKFLAR
ncbi:MAG: hypothetical protein IH991_05075 [Planctomycetes bacterium]|nr:hypothetical protein [Planctomycetota bacterium]